ncbi:MAG: endopeptidase La [Deltaproteobacteria bacterium]|nr:MAG: endopeptidase La [Deltaproteobacteria bacterium]
MSRFQDLLGGKVDLSKIPEELPILPVRNIVLFPWMIVPLLVARKKSMALIDEVSSGEKFLGVVVQKNAEEEDPKARDIVRYGTVAHVLKMLRFPDGSQRVLVQGLKRFKIVRYTARTPFFKAKVLLPEEPPATGKRIEALMRNLKDLFQEYVSASPLLSPEALAVASNMEDAGRFADFVAANLDIRIEEKQAILESIETQERLERVSMLLNHQLEIKTLAASIQNKIKTEMDRSQREYYLKEQLKAIRKELGEEEGSFREIEEFQRRITEAQMPAEVEKEAFRELDRMTRMHAESAEYTVARTYLDWLTSLPWRIATEDNLDIHAVERVLDEDHYDLRAVKERILEYIAVRKLNPAMKGPILCFVGPPGVGKTSLGRSIARALGRKFQRISLGGMRDEAEIRGHRKTYVGAMPGRIINEIRKAGARNPVIVLDEVDKVGMDFRGDPSSALLEVLDPEQNATFTDHYLNVPFDLSQVIFLATANLADPIPPALKDRMEILEIPGYIEEEKVLIVQRHIVPKLLAEHGLSPEKVTIRRSAIHTVIRDYTREAGLRNLERELASILRKVARRIAEKGEPNRKISICPKDVVSYLGPPRFHSELAERTDIPGVAIGLAWTAAGGEILFVESSRMRGKERLQITGQLGDVMKESAQTALSYVRAKAQELGIDEDFWQTSDLHLHLPSGAIPKDGPSAGITMAVSLASLLTGRRVRSDLAMTGELTLRGKVLPVGGIKEKVLAARRAGIGTIILPHHNRKDLEKIPKHLRRNLKFHFVTTVDEVLELALEKEP